MTGASNTKLLPLPERFDCTNGNTPWCQGCYTMTPNEYGDYVQWEDYERITAAQAAEIERLRAEVEAWRELSDHVRAGACNAIWPDRYTDARTRDVAAALKRAERLAEALRDALEYLHHHLPDEALAPHRAALYDHSQERKDG